MTNMKMAAFFSRKLIICASIPLRKSCLGSKLGDLRSGIHSCSFKIDQNHRNPKWLTCMSKKNTFLDMYQFETYINGFLDLDYPNFDPKHGFLSSVEAEIISFCQRRQPFAFSAFYVNPLTFEGGSPSIFDK